MKHGNLKSLQVHEWYYIRSSLLWSYCWCGFSIFVKKEWKRKRIKVAWNFLHLSTTTITGLVVPARPQALAPDIDVSTLMGSFSNFYPTLLSRSLFLLVMVCTIQPVDREQMPLFCQIHQNLLPSTIHELRFKDKSQIFWGSANYIRSSRDWL